MSDMVFAKRRECPVVGSGSDTSLLIGTGQEYTNYQNAGLCASRERATASSFKWKTTAIKCFINGDI